MSARAVSVVEAGVLLTGPRPRFCSDCLVEQLADDDPFDGRCATCATEYERHRALQREMAEDFEFSAAEMRDHKATCRFCSSYGGPAPLGGLRALCRANRERGRS